MVFKKISERRAALAKVTISFMTLSGGVLGMFFPWSDSIVLHSKLLGSYGESADLCVDNPEYPKAAGLVLNDSPSMTLHTEYSRRTGETPLCDNHNYVLAHEWGHAVWDEGIHPQLQKLYCKSFEKSGYTATSYGNTNCAENFAEVYAGLLMGTIENKYKYGQLRIVDNAIKSYQLPNLRVRDSY